MPDHVVQQVSWVNLRPSSRTNTKRTMKLGRAEIKCIVLLNYSVLALLCLYQIIHSALNIATTTQYLTTHLPRQQTEKGCNGREEYCDRTYDNITQIATHGSPFSGVMPSDNQNVGVEAQLDAGIRFLQAQTRKGLIFSGLKLCHTSCMMEDAGPLEDYLRRVKHWLDSHPNEVVTLLLTNGGFLDIGAFEQVFTKVGLVDIAFAPPPRPRRKRAPKVAGRWPTLRELIKKKQRLVVFLDYGAKPAKVPYILDQFDHFWETPFNTVDPNFRQCDIDRPPLKKDASKEAVAQMSSRMYLVNHYLDTTVLGIKVPNRRDAKKTNAAEGEGSIGAQAALCEQKHGHKPKVVLVNYFDVGQVLKAQDRLNGIL